MSKEINFIFYIVACIQSFLQDILLGDASKAKNKFGWKPTISFKVITLLYQLNSECIWTYSIII